MHLLERASVELACPDFGMRLAVAQGGLKVLGPLEFAMRNSRTLREAFRYCAEHLQVYGTASKMRFEEGHAPDALFLRFEILVARLPNHLQTVERALLLTQNTALGISNGQVRAREVWFTHDPLTSPSVYAEYFRTTVRFGQSMTGLFFTHQDLDAPIPNVDPQIYELTTEFIEHRFPSADAGLSTRVRAVVERLLLEGDCVYNSVASMLGMHPRTLQRRLRAEGESFETIKDGVRRDTRAALPARLRNAVDSNRQAVGLLRDFGFVPQLLSLVLRIAAATAYSRGHTLRRRPNSRERLMPGHDVRTSGR